VALREIWLGRQKPYCSYMSMAEDSDHWDTFPAHHDVDQDEDQSEVGRNQQVYYVVGSGGNFEDPCDLACDSFHMEAAESIHLLLLDEMGTFQLQLVDYIDLVGTVASTVTVLQAFRVDTAASCLGIYWVVPYAADSHVLALRTFVDHLAKLCSG